MALQKYKAIFIKRCRYITVWVVECFLNTFRRNTKMKKNIKKWCILSLCIIMVPLIPMVIGAGVSSDIFLNWTNNNDWIGFWGSYVGAMIGAAIPLIILRMEKQEERKQSVLPILSIMQENGITQKHDVEEYRVDYLTWDGRLEEFILNDKQHSDVKKEIDDRSRWFHTDLLVKNIGKGPVLNLRVYFIGKVEILNTTFAISLGEKETMRYHLVFKGIKVKTGDEEENRLIFCFENAYKKEYYQTIDFTARYYENQYMLCNFKFPSELKEGNKEEALRNLKC